MQRDEEQRALVIEQTTIEETLTAIQQQLDYFDRENFHLSINNPDQIRQRLQQMSTTLNQVEKSHWHLFSPRSSTDSTISERAQHLSSFHEQLKSSTQVRFHFSGSTVPLKTNVERVEFYSLFQNARLLTDKTILS